MDDFAQLLRRWRSNRRLSQGSLADEAEVSARHISFLESARSKPSRSMVLTLAQALAVPAPVRNQMLLSAGFAAVYQRETADSEHLSQVSAAVTRLLDRHAPYPAICFDQDWTLKALNVPATALFAQAGLGVGDSLLTLSTDATRAARMIENWGEVGQHLLHRLRAQSRKAGGLPRLDRAAALMAKDPAIAGYQAGVTEAPMIKAVYRVGTLRLPLFSALLSFTGVEDNALSGDQIELFFPTTQDAEQLLKQLMCNLEGQDD